jgi:hypothetical protein
LRLDTHRIRRRESFALRAREKKNDMSNTPTRRVIHPEIKILDAKKGLCQYIASDESLDSYNEIIRASGWRFDQFQKNAPFVDSHDYSDISKLLGKVIDYKLDGKQLVETVQWAIDVPENSLAALGWKMTQGGYLKAVSVGFWPTKMVSKWDQDPNPFNIECLDLKVDPKTVRCIYTEQQQVELSACIIGANPNALAKALKDGHVTETEVMRLFQNPADKTDSPAHAPGRAAESSTSRARRWFLEELTQAMKRL